MPEKKIEDPAILIDRRGMLLTFEAYLDDQLIHRFGALNASGQGHFSGITPHLIPIEQKFHGKTLSFRIFSDYSNIGLRGRLFLGAKADLIQNIIVGGIDRFIIGLLIIFVGLFDIFVAMENFKQKENIPFFGLYAVCVGLYTINITNIKDLIFYAPIFWFNVYIVSLTLMPVGVIGFIWQTFRPKSGSVLHRLWQIHIAYAILCLASYLMALSSWIPSTIGYQLVNVLRFFFIPEILFILWIVTVDAFIKENVNARIYICGLLPLAISGIHDILVGLGKIDSSHSFIHWGLLFFVLCLGLIRRRYYVDIKNRLRLYSSELEKKSKEKEKLLKDLHDGIGGVTTNISFLAEMAKETSSVTDIKKILSNISELSRESLSEIRSFMHSLDEKETNWPSMIAELRHRGGNMIESHGISCHIKTCIDENTNQPSSLLCLNLFRIYKEALTNIVKHSKAKVVNVIINVSLEKLFISIRDDGIGLEEVKKMGRGITNMKARAREIGGKLTVTHDKGTCVRLDLPLP